MATDMLDEEYNRQRAAMRSRLSGSYLTLSVDAWTGPNGAPVLGFCIGPHCLYAFETRGIPHTGDQVKRWIQVCFLYFMCYLLSVSMTVWPGQG